MVLRHLRLQNLFWLGATVLILTSFGGLLAIDTARADRKWGLAIAVVSAVVLGIAGHRLLVARQSRRSGAALIIAAVLMIAIVAVYLQILTGYWRDEPGYNLNFLSWFSGSNTPVLLSAMVSALVARVLHPIPFLTGIASISAFFVMGELSSWLAGNQLVSWSLAAAFSKHVLPVSIILLAYVMDRRGMARGDAGWLHGIGAFFAWFSVTDWILEAAPEAGNQPAASLLLNTVFAFGFLGLALFLWRGAYAVVGIMGLLVFLNHVLGQVMGGWALLPVVLLVTVMLNLWFHGAFERPIQRLEAAMLARLPGWLIRLRPPSA